MEAGQPLDRNRECADSGNGFIAYRSVAQGLKKNRITLKGSSLGTVIMILGVAAAGAASFAEQYPVNAAGSPISRVACRVIIQQRRICGGFRHAGLATALP